MNEFSELLRQGTTNAWLFIPSAILLGALHGLEPGHSKTMMAAFIVAIRGTVAQAVMLGLAATVSHTAVVWLVAMSGLYFGGRLNAEETEPYFQVVSAAIIIGVAFWMMMRTWQEGREHRQEIDHHHDLHDHHHLEDHDHQHDLELAVAGFQDAHEVAHTEDIRRRFASRQVTTGQIVLFGLTGGLIPCPAAITVLFVCLQVKEVTLGAALVLCFSIGLALTLVFSGTLAALSVQHVSRRWSGFGELARRAPYVSGALILLVGLYIGYHGLQGIIG